MGKIMIRTWQDFDEDCIQTWGLWFATYSVGGHVRVVAGPFLTEDEAVESVRQTEI